MGTSCIIPVYNEAGRIGKVLGELTKIDEIEQIICVDESSDGSVEEIGRYPQVKILHFARRLGKVGAIRKGLKLCKSKNVLLFDSDFVGFGAVEVIQAIKIFENNQMGMLVLRMVDNPLPYRLLNFDLALSGERILKREDLVKILRAQIEGYQLELSINDYFIEKKASVYWVPLSGHNPSKQAKWGVGRGTREGWEMTKKTVGYKGWKYYLNRIIFCGFLSWE